MYRYEYVNFSFNEHWSSVTLFGHKGTIDEYAQQGYRYVGYIPTKIKGAGMIVEVDLIFEIEEA